MEEGEYVVHLKKINYEFQNSVASSASEMEKICVNELCLNVVLVSFQYVILRILTYNYQFR